MMGHLLSTKLRDTGNGNLVHWCPGCGSLHLINIQEKNHLGAIWTWDGDNYRPTFHPSINIVELPDLPEWMIEREFA